MISHDFSSGLPVVIKICQFPVRPTHPPSPNAYIEESNRFFIKKDGSIRIEHPDPVADPYTSSTLVPAGCYCLLRRLARAFIILGESGGSLIPSKALCSLPII